MGFSQTGAIDSVMGGDGTVTTFRELKPGTTDAMFEGWAPLRWCLFVEPVNLYRGSRARLEVVLANEDALPPGQYPARLKVIGPGLTRAWERNVTVTIPPAGVAGQKEPPMVVPVLAEDVLINGPAGGLMDSTFYREIITQRAGRAKMHPRRRWRAASTPRSTILPGLPPLRVILMKILAKVNIRQTRTNVNLGKRIDLASIRGLLFYCVAPWMPRYGNWIPNETPTCVLSFLSCERRFRSYIVRCPNCGAKRAIGRAGTPMRSSETRSCKKNSIRPTPTFAN